MSSSTKTPTQAFALDNIFWKGLTVIGIDSARNDRVQTATRNFGQYLQYALFYKQLSVRDLHWKGFCEEERVRCQ